MAQVTELSVTATPGRVHTFTAKEPADEVTIDGESTFDLVSQHEAIRIQSDGDDWWIL